MEPIFFLKVAWLERAEVWLFFGGLLIGAAITASSGVVKFWLKDYARNRQLNREVPATLQSFANSTLAAFGSNAVSDRMIEIHWTVDRLTQPLQVAPVSSFAQQVGDLFRAAGLETNVGEGASLWREEDKNDMLLVYNHKLSGPLGRAVYEVLIQMGYTVRERDFDPRDGVAGSDTERRIQLMMAPPYVY